MAKTLKEAPLTTPSARSRLPQGVHWRGLDPEVHLGYRRGRRGGVWLVRWRDAGIYRQTALGTADDVLKAGTLSFDAASIAARKKVEEERIAALAAAAGPAPTVRSAVEAYIAERDARDTRRQGREVRSDAAHRLGRHVLGEALRGEVPPEAPLAGVKLHRLRETDLRLWLAGLSDTLTPDSKRRLANDLKAALNAACDIHRENLPASIPDAVKRGLRVEVDEEDRREVARANQILTDAQVTVLLSHARDVDGERDWDGDLYRLLVVLAATGMRFAQVKRLAVRDVQRDRRRLLVPVSRKGKGIKSGFTAVPVGEDVMDALLPVTVGRETEEPLLQRWRRGQAPGSMEWIKDKRGEWRAASEISRDWRTIKSRAGLPHVDPYAFRHSSIVRALRANLPIRLVAARHDTSILMIEKHYSRWIVDGLEDMLAAAVVPLVPPAVSNVVRLA